MQRALAIVREGARTKVDEIRPTHNLELDLGLDSMQRIELLTALEQQLGGDVPESRLGDIYTARDLVDAILESAGRGEGGPRAAAPAWSTILSEPVTDPEVLALGKHQPFAELFFYLLGRVIYLFFIDAFHLRVSGLENLPQKGPYLLCSNHQSYFDPIALGALLPWRVFRNTFAVGTSEIFGQGFMRHLARWLRVVVVDPDANLVPAMRAGAYGLRQGRVLMLYPEGERSASGEPVVFRKGAAILSIHEQAPIVPVAINGFYEAWPRHQKFPKIARLEMTIGTPITPPPASQASESEYERLTSELKQRVVTMREEFLRVKPSESSGKPK